MTNATGLSGTLIFGINDTPYFRVYKKSGIFTDYRLQISDLNITIGDSDATIYNEDSNDPYIDYSPETLGR